MLKEGPFSEPRDVVDYQEPAGPFLRHEFQGEFLAHWPVAGIPQ
jgi:hypothetical protein